MQNAHSTLLLYQSYTTARFSVKDITKKLIGLSEVSQDFWTHIVECRKKQKNEAVYYYNKYSGSAF